MTTHYRCTLAWRTFYALAFSTIALVGCDKRGTPGGPGATSPDAKPPLYGQADDTFNLTAASVSIKAGDAEKGMIGIKRGTNFDQDVAVSFSDLPKGITIDSAAHVIKSGATEANFTLTAGEDAAPGDYTVKISGHPGKGGDATNQFKLTVVKKDTFTLSTPFWTTGLKQGETRAVAIGISRDARFDQDVTLKIDGLPKGITAEPSSVLIKAGDKEAKFSLKAADDAALGDFSVTLMGHPAKGADATHVFKFTVARK